MPILIFFLLHWYLSLLFQSIFLHRYVSHGMYKMNAFWEKIFFLFTFLIQGSSFLNPAAYGLMHRKHHAYSDTEKDPHSPTQSNDVFSFNMKTFVQYRKLVNKVLEKGFNNQDLPRWLWLEKLAELIMVRALFVVLYILFYIKYATSVWQFLFIPIHIFMGPIHGFIVNWFGHKVGYRNHKEVPDKSRNSLPIDLLMVGELYQNNHHRYPNKLNFAYRWFEVDLGFMVTYLFKRLKIIK